MRGSFKFVHSLRLGLIAGAVLMTAMTCTPAVPVSDGIWLKGDLHLHSEYSTDSEYAQMDRVVEIAEILGMDYFAFTDHDNHVLGNLAPAWNDPRYSSDSMVMLYGVEYTTGRAHVNFFSDKQWDHRSLWFLRDGEAKPYVDEANRLGLHVSINHPFNQDGWEHPWDVDFDSVEVWQALQAFPWNAEAMKKWDEMLASGRRVVGRGGSDVHNQFPNPESGVSNVGNPTTWIRSEGRNGAAIIDGLDAGNVSISYDPAAERIELYADGNGDGSYEGQIGDNLTPTNGPVNLLVNIEGARQGAEYEIRVIKNGTLWRTLTTQAAQTVIVDSDGTGNRSYYRVEVRGDTPLKPGEILDDLYMGLIGITNPIYFGYAN